MLARYHEVIIEQALRPDKHQLMAIAALGELFDKLIDKNAEVATEETQAATPLTGLYIYGPVGRGKSFLMNIFFECLPEHLSLRLHFHRFMHRVHNALRDASGMPEPLEYVADKLANESRVLCFDEFYVTDIGDAMILYRLFDALFSRGVTLIATSNIAINELYKDGLHRQRIEPAIELLNMRLDTIHLDGPVDYRFTNEIYRQTYFLDSETDFTRLFETLIHKKNISQTPDFRTIEICNRPIDTQRMTEHLIWFDFSAICEGARSQLDYIELADRFHTVMISNVPAFSGEVTSRIKARGTEDSAMGLSTGGRIVLAANHDNAARRFISLVDEFYDRGVVLYVSAEVPITALYVNGILSEEFNRTRSRLMEMQSEKYIKANER